MEQWNLHGERKKKKKEERKEGKHEERNSWLARKAEKAVTKDPNLATQQRWK